MPKTKVAVTLESDLLGRVDELVAKRKFPSRSQAVETALAEKLERMAHSRLARECAKLDRHHEQRLAEEGLTEDAKAWPAY